MSFAAIDLDLQAVKTALGHVRDLALEESFTTVSKAQALRIANVMRRSELDTASLVACMEKVRDVGFAEVDKTMLLTELTTLLSNPNLDAMPTIVKKAANSTQKWEHCVHALSSEIWERMSACKHLDVMFLHLADLGLHRPCEKTARAMAMAFLLATEGVDRAFAINKESRKQTVEVTKTMWKTFANARQRPDPMIWDFPGVSAFERLHPDIFAQVFTMRGVTPQGPKCSGTEWLMLVQGTNCRGHGAARPSGVQPQQFQSGDALASQNPMSAFMPLMATLTQMCQQMVGPNGRTDQAQPRRSPSPDEFDLTLVGGAGGAGGAAEMGGERRRLPDGRDAAPVSGERGVHFGRGAALAIEAPDAAEAPPAPRSPVPAPEEDEVDAITAQIGKHRAETLKERRVLRKPAASMKRPAAANEDDGKQPKKVCTAAATMKAAGYVPSSCDAVKLPRGWSVWTKPPRPDKYFVSASGQRYRSVNEVKASLGI